MKRFVLYLMACMLLAACTKHKGYVPEGGYPPGIDRIIVSNCAVSGCHTAESRAVAGGINLENWRSLFEGSSSGAAVVPYSSRFSPLTYFINTHDDLGLRSEPTMPLNRKPLSREKVIEIRRWIDNGAPDADGKIMWAEDAARRKMYAANQGCDLVMVLDSETGLTTRAVEVGVSFGSDAPHHVRVSPDGQFWYVIFINSNFMQKFRCSDDSYVGDIPLTPYAAKLSADNTQDARDWNAFVISNDGKKAFVTSWTSNGKVSVVDLENRRFIRWIGGQHFPHGIALNKANDRIYVTAQTGNFITELDTGLQEAVQIPLGSALNYASSLDIHDALLSTDGTELWVTCQKTNDVRVVDLGTRSLKRVVPTATYPQEIVFSSAVNRYFVSCLGDTAVSRGQVSVISPSDFSVVNVSCGNQPHGLAVDEKSRLLYVLSRNLGVKGQPGHHGSVCAGRNGFVNFMSLDDFTVQQKTFELSVDPYHIFPRP